MVRAAFVLWFGLIVAAPAQPVNEAATQLAGRISSLLQRRGTVSLELQNLAQLPPADSSAFRTALEEELRKVGLEMASTAQPDVRIRVTVSENPRGLLFIADAVAGDNRQVAMLPWPMPRRADAKPGMRINIRPLWEQAEPILDVQLLDSGETMLVLGPANVSSFRLTNGKWTPAGALAIAISRPLPRDPRGRLTGGHAYLPDASCRIAMQPDLRLTCTADNERWPVGAATVRWQPDRNLLESDGVRGAVYSVAAGFVATADGRVQDRSGEQIPGASAWGSDLTATENPCGSDPVVIASKAGDASDQDAVEAYTIVNGQPRAAAEPLSLPGPITALWPSDILREITIVVRNSKTGNYEASRLGLACAE